MHIVDQLAVLPALTNSTGEGAIPDELIVTFFMIKSAIDDNVYGPFATHEEACEFAEQVDASVFELTARVINVKEV